jgi:hypothetical protein
MAKRERVVKVKIEPEIDLSSLTDEVLTVLADKVAERLQGREKNVTKVFLVPTHPQYAPSYPLPGQIWC